MDEPVAHTSQLEPATRGGLQAFAQRLLEKRFERTMQFRPIL
ncbi:hypothetical protein [Caballeronia sp. INDeC2]|nr:hypothetical protein [Caballeronia sp. INDeC2]